MMYLQNGRVSIQTPFMVTFYHGAYSEDDAGITINFSWTGDMETNDQTLVLSRAGLDEDGNEQYDGQDSTGRYVVLTARDTLQWCNSCRNWHFMTICVSSRLGLHL